MYKSNFAFARYTLFTFFLFFLIQNFLYAAELSFSWTPNTESNLAGYKIYYGAASRNYSVTIDVGNPAPVDGMIIYTVTDLPEGQTLYFAATAYDLDGLESDYSEEVVCTCSSQADYTDTDNDGISDEDEISLYGTDPNDSDTDNDGISDGDEIDLWGQDWDADYDADTIINLLDDDADGDGILDGDDSEPSIPAPLFTTGEYPDGGGVKGIATFNDTWQTVNFNSGFNMPVVIAGPASYNDAAPGLIRLQNVTGNSFEIKFQEWQYLADQGLAAHDFEENSYLVIEEGVHKMDYGSIWEAGTFEHSRSATTVWETIYFAANFPAAPYVFLTIQTYNDPHPVIVRVKNVTKANFQAVLFEEEALTDGHEIEKIGYLAVYNNTKAGELSGTGSLYHLATGKANHNFTSILGHEIKLHEEQSADKETVHTFESINALQIDNTFFAQSVSRLGGDPFSIRQRPSFYSSTSFNDKWNTVLFNKNIENPVVITGPPSYNGADPGVIRLRNVTNNSFEIQFQEWDYKAAARVHTLEDASWLVMEPGIYNMEDGSVWQIGTFPLSGTGVWSSVNFNQAFTGAPAVYLTMQTFNGASAVTVRAQNASNTGFQAALFEEEALMASGHAIETIGYLAIYSPNAAGSITIDNQQITYSIGIGATNHNFTKVSGYEVKMEEEQSYDDELNHVYETLNTLTVNNTFFCQGISFNGPDTIAVRYRIPK